MKKLSPKEEQQGKSCKALLRSQWYVPTTRYKARGSAGQGAGKGTREPPGLFSGIVFYNHLHLPSCKSEVDFPDGIKCVPEKEILPPHLFPEGFTFSKVTWKLCQTKP